MFLYNTGILKTTYYPEKPSGYNNTTSGLIYMKFRIVETLICQPSVITVIFHKSLSYNMKFSCTKLESWKPPIILLYQILEGLKLPKYWLKVGLYHFSNFMS